MNVDPQRGDVVLVDGRASVQFAGIPFGFRVISTTRSNSTPTGWIWITGYVLDKTGAAIQHRELFVQVAGLQLVAVPASRYAPTRNGGPTPPRQRTKPTETRTGAPR